MKKKISFINRAILEVFLNRLGVIQHDAAPENIEIVINDTKVSISKEDFAKAIETKSLAIKDENLMVFNKPDYETRTKNIETQKYNEGKTAGVEMTAKEIKKKYALEDIEGKDLGVLFETYADRKIKAANIPADKKVIEHEKTISELQDNLKKLTTDNETLISEKEQIANDFKQKEYQLQIDNTLNLLVPEASVTETLTRKDIIALFRSNGFDAKMVDGKIVAVKDNEVVKHSVTLEPLSLKDVLTKFVNDKKLIPTEGGRGAGDNTGGDTAGSWEAFVKEMEAKGINQGSAKFQEEQSKRIKNKTLKV